MKVVIVGAGVLGAALAHRLSTEEGVEVVVHESGRLSGGTSAVGAGWFNSGGKEPFAYHLLNVHGMAEHATLARELGDAPWYHPTGNLQWAAPGAEETLVSKVRHLREWGYPVEWLGPRRVNEIEPYVRVPAGVDRIAHFPLEGLLDLPQMVGELLRRAEVQGARIHTFSPVKSLHTTGERVDGVVLEDDTVESADLVAVCAGRWSDQLVATAGWELPMAPTMGFNIYTGPAPVILHGMVHTPEVNFRPEGAGRTLVRAMDLDTAVGLDTPMDPIPPVGRELLARAVKYLPGLSGATIEGARVAMRSIPGDGLPVVGHLDALPGLYLLVTHSGATLGPLLGRLAAQEIAQGADDERLVTFRPSRIVTKP